MTGDWKELIYRDLSRTHWLTAKEKTKEICMQAGCIPLQTWVTWVSINYHVNRTNIDLPLTANASI